MNDNAYTGRQDPISCPANQVAGETATKPVPQQVEDLCHEIAPVLKQLRECVLGYYEPATLDLLERTRACLKRWAGRFAASPHAVAHVKETLLLLEEINERLLKGRV